MTPSTDLNKLLEREFPGEQHCYFAPIAIGDTPEDADSGAALILNGIKTATSSAQWDYPDGKIPFAGALSVLLDGRQQAVAIVETQRVASVAFKDIDAEFAHAYGEGDRTLAWFKSEIGAWYRRSAKRAGSAFSDDTPIICEWIAVVRRF